MKKEENQVFTYKTSLAGDGSLYKWNKYDEKGNVVEESAQTFNSEADAEKNIRTLASKSDIVEVETIKNINVDANTNVDLVRDDAVVDERYAGMRRVSEGIEDIAAENAPKEKGAKGSKAAQEEEAPEPVDPHPVRGESDK